MYAPLENMWRFEGDCDFIRPIKNIAASCSCQSKGQRTCRKISHDRKESRTSDAKIKVAIFVGSHTREYLDTIFVQKWSSSGILARACFIGNNKTDYYRSLISDFLTAHQALEHLGCHSKLIIWILFSTFSPKNCEPLLISIGDVSIGIFQTWRRDTKANRVQPCW